MKHLTAPAWTRNVRPMSRDKSDMLTLLVACVLVLLPHFLQLPVGASSAVVALLCWRGWITYAGHRLPPRWLLVPIAALTMAGVWIAYRTFFGRDAGVAMLALLLTLKLLEMHAKRDLFVVLFLSYFVILTNFFFSQTIATAVVTVAAVIMLLTAQQSFQYTGLIPPLKKRLRLSAMIFAMATPLMLVMFVLFPRVQGPLWGLPGDANSARSGLSDSMGPGDISSLAQSDDIAFRVKFTDALPPQSSLYWRAAVLGNFDGRNWTQQIQVPLSPGSFLIPAGATMTRYQVTLEPHGRRWLFALELPTELPQLTGQRSFLVDDFQLLAAQPINSRIRYDVTSSTRFVMEPTLTAARSSASLALPQGFNPATAAMAQRLRQQSDNPLVLVELVLRYFRAEPFSYTLTPALLGRNSVDDFLFNTRAGFCEHYAAAFVVLMRGMGIPARVVTGYQGGELNPVDGYLEVRQSDAHAWAEVWIAARGWIRVDPTAAVAPERVQRSEIGHARRTILGGLVTLSRSRASWLSGVRLGWDAMSNSWNQWVLNYSAERQKSLISALGLGEFDWAKLTLLMVAAGSAVLAATLLPLLVRRERIDPAMTMYHKFCRRMSRLGVTPHIEHGPRTYGERIAATEALRSAKKAAALEFLDHYETLQYGTVGGLARSVALTQLKSRLNYFLAISR